MNHSLCCTLETNTILYINSTLILKKEPLQKTNVKIKCRDDHAQGQQYKGSINTGNVR